MEHTDAKNIETYTFGTPGTLDYDIGHRIAKVAGTQQTSIDLTTVGWTKDDVLETAKQQDRQAFLFHHVPAYILKRFEGAIVWSGYIGDAVTGGHLKRTPAQTLDEAATRYLKTRSAVKSTTLRRHNLDELKPLLGGGTLAPDILSFDEQVLFAEVGSVTAPHVMPHGFTYKTPFIDNDFMTFFVSIPNIYRLNQTLFISMLRQTWPDLLNLPSKTNHGFAFDAPHWRIQAKRARNRCLRFAHDHFAGLPLPPHPATNFLDYDTAIRRNAEFQNLIRTFLDDLKNRTIVSHVDIDGLWTAHVKGRANHGDALIILASLEINLQATDSIVEQNPSRLHSETARGTMGSDANDTKSRCRPGCGEFPGHSG